MAPEAHIDWLADNASWFETVGPAHLSWPVPNCPGWTVEDVINHLSLGVGLGYRACTTTPVDETFTGLGWPSGEPTGIHSVTQFAENMGGCIRVFRTTDPEQACYTYAGPGKAKFWFRRAAVETTIHQLDVSDAIGLPHPMPDERLRDAITETVNFAVPLAAAITSVPSAAATVACPELGFEAPLTHPTLDTRSEVTLSGTGQDMLLALWGRAPTDLEIEGDQQVAQEWLSLSARAFGSAR